MEGTLWERSAVSGAVTELLQSARAGAGGVLFVEGQPGLGKTSILEAAGTLARPDLRVGLGQGDTMEMSLPFGVLDQALSMISGPPLNTAHRGAAVRSEQLYRLLRWLEAADQGVLIALDDVHWADSDSLELVALLCRRIGSLPVAVIATMRPWPEEARAMASTLADAGAARRLLLAPLSREASTEMLMQRSGQAVSDAAATRAWELCTGNPLLLEQVALAIGRGAIDAEAADSWPSLEPDSLLLSRFAGLPHTALRYVRAASVLGVRFRPDVAADLSGVSETDADRAVEALCRSGLIEQTSPGTVRFVHPLFAQALYDDLPGPVRDRLHARSFEVLADRGMDAEATEHALRAGAHDAHEIITVLERAGRAALDVGALGTAATQLTAAVGLCGERATTDLLLSHAEALLGSGDPVAASRAYERVLARGGIDVGVRADALRMRGRALYAGGDHVTAAACFTEAADLMLPDDPTAAADALIDQALSMNIVLGPRGCLPLARRAIELVPDPDSTLRVRADAAHGYLTVMAGDPVGLAQVAIAADVVRAHPRPDIADPAWTWGLTSIHAHAAKYLEEFEVAARGFRSVRTAAEQLGAAEALTMSLIGEAEVAARTGRLTEALALSDRAAELTDLVPLGATYNAVVRFFVLLHLDRAEQADHCCRQLETLLDDRDEGISRIWLLHLQGIRHLGLGRPQSAAQTYLRAEQLSDRLGIGEPCVVPWAGRAVIAHARAGNVADADRVLTSLDASANRLPCRYPRVAAAFGRAEVAMGHTEHGAAEHHFLDALAHHGEADLSMERTSTLLAYGSMLQRSGRPAQARKVLAEALESAESISAPALARHAREGLSATGGRRRRRTPDGQLTPQELRIARMFRSGASRREIAQRLTVSEATVRTHFEHIYTKLDVHSAQELMASTLPQLTDGDVHQDRSSDRA